MNRLQRRNEGRVATLDHSQGSVCFVRMFCALLKQSFYLLLSFLEEGSNSHEPNKPASNVQPKWEIFHEEAEATAEKLKLWLVRRDDSYSGRFLSQLAACCCCCALTRGWACSDNPLHCVG